MLSTINENIIAATQPTPNRPSVRYASPDVAQVYPLATRTDLTWRAVAGGWQASVELGALDADELLVPSFTLLGVQPYSYRCSLTADSRQWPLNRVGPEYPQPPVAAQVHSTTSDAVAAQIDLWHTRRACAAAVFHVLVHTPTRPQRFLLVIARRTALLPAQALSTAAAMRPQLNVPTLSQMNLPPTIRHHTCSPTAMRMVLAYYGRATGADFVDRCRDPATMMFGVWPRNLLLASRYGCIGAVELASTATDLAAVPGPLVTSIRFAAGELQGAPLARTGGHLVVVTGRTADTVLCNDPAASGAASVPVAYSAAEFDRAWLCARGAAYIVVPCD